MANDELRSEVEKFLRETGMAQTTFGRLAISDGNFVRDLQRGRRMWPENAARVMRFIRSNRQRTGEVA